jgi:nicotinamidase-related amidase
MASIIRQADLAVLVIDVQPYFMHGWAAAEAEPILARLEFLFGIATVYDLPTICTFEQPVERKGWLPERLEPFVPARAPRLTKRTFDCCAEPEVMDAIRSLGRRQFAVAGAETDVCVLQSVLGLLNAGLEVFVLEDAIFSSEPNTGPAVRRMERAGAVPSTVKTLNYELRRSVDAMTTERLFAARRPGLKLPEPEALPAFRPPRLGPA